MRRKTINETRCIKCGLIQPCHCVSDERHYLGEHPHDDEPLIIFNKRNRRHTTHLQGAEKFQETNVLNRHSNIIDVAREADRQAVEHITPARFGMKTMNYIREMFNANPDNKLALKLFGNKAAVMLEQRRQSKQGKGVIHPFSTFRWYWDILLIIFIFMHVLLLPVSIAFLSDDLSIHWLVLNGVSDVFFVLDIFLNFRTGIIDPHNQEEVILDIKVIKTKYIRGWFIMDLLSSLPFDYAYFIASSTDAEALIKASRALRILKLAKLLSLLRLLRVSRLVRYMTRFEELLNIAKGQLRIMKLICCMLILSHWNGCVQFFIPYLEEFPESSWVAIGNLQNASPGEQYSWALFKAMSHMLCIGYGRYPPQTTSEVWVTLCSMTTGATFYAVFIGIMSSLIMSIDSSGRLYNEKLSQVEEYMRYRKLPLRIRLQVQEFYEHRFHHKLFDEDAILAELSKNLREVILVNNIRPLLTKVPFFSGASVSFITNIVTKLQFEVYLPGDFICRSGQKGKKMYFIQKGIVDILTRDGALATSLGDGSHFGEICLLTEEARRVASVRAATTCDTYSLSATHFHEVLSDYPEMKSVLEEVAKERLARIGLQPKLSGQQLPANKERSVFAFDIETSHDDDIKRTPIVEPKATTKEPKASAYVDDIPEITISTPQKGGKHGGILTQAFIRSVAPGLASFASGSQDSQESEDDTDAEELDDYVLATIADF